MGEGARRGDLSRLVVAALAAAVLGSIAGALIYCAYDVSRSSAGLSLATIPTFLVFVMLAAVTGMVIAVPANLLIGVPLAWPARRLIAAHPLAAFLLFGPVGAAAGWALYRLIDTSAFPGREDVPSAIFGATVAAVFVLLIRAWRPAEA